MPFFPLSVAFAAPAELPPEAERRIDEALDAVNATGEQRSTVYRLVNEILPQAKALREEAQALRAGIHELFLQPEIDRAALEDLRVDAVDLFDRATSFAFANLADLAEVFTVEQRRALHALREEHHRRFAKLHGWHHDE